MCVLVSCLTLLSLVSKTPRWKNSFTWGSNCLLTPEWKIHLLPTVYNQIWWCWLLSPWLHSPLQNTPMDILIWWSQEKDICNPKSTCSTPLLTLPWESIHKYPKLNGWRRTTLVEPNCPLGILQPQSERQNDLSWTTCLLFLLVWMFYKTQKSFGVNKVVFYFMMF